MFAYTILTRWGQLQNQNYRSPLKWKVEYLPGDMYRFVDLEDADLQLILEALGIKIPAKFYRWAELKHIKTGIRNIM